MELAQGNAVAGHGVASVFAIANDVSGVDQLEMPKGTQRTPLLVCADDPLTKRRLVHARLHSPGHVRAACGPFGY